VWAVGMLLAFGVYLTTEEGHFVGWVFLVPFAVVGAVLYVFGKWSVKVGGKDKPKPR